MKRRRILIGLLILTLLLAAPARADLNPGSLDTGFDTSNGANDYIHVVAVQPDGRVLIGGNFTQVEGTPRSRIARLNADGSLDTSFDSSTGANGWVVAVAVQLNGKVLIGGIFTQVDGTPRNSIARLNTGGSLDTSFNPGSGATVSGSNGWVFALAVQPDGKVLVGGDFTEINGTGRIGIARLKTDGSLDTSFDPGSGASRVKAIALQPDGKVLICGEFITVNGTSRNRIARLNANGSLDTSFDPGQGASSWVEAVAVQEDGKVLIGGQFTEVDGTTRNRIARLNSNGTLDTTFTPSSGADSEVSAIAVQDDGKVLIAGGFSLVNGTILNYVARLNTDGSLDTGFNPGSGAGNWLKAVVIQADGKVLVGGVFTQFDGTARKYVARLNADGSLDTGFDTSSGANDHVLAAAIQPDGKVLLGGRFVQVNGQSLSGVARLNANGTLDTTFNPGSGTNNLVEALVIQADGKVLIGGWFNQVNGVSRGGIARLNADGSLDTGFNPGSGANGFVSALALQPDGKVLIGGLFNEVNSVSRSGIARLNSNGTLDSSFSPGSGADNWVRTVALQADGKVLIGGWFNQVNGETRNFIARLKSDGSLDTGFDPGTGANHWVEVLAVQSDGKVVIGGSFTQVNNQPRNYIERLTANGSPDSSFNTSTGADGYVAALLVQPDGKVIIGGSFTQFTGVARSGIARLNASGSLDTGFDPGTGTNAAVRTLVTQVDGKLLIGGEFTQVDSNARNYIARLNAATPPVFTSAAPSSPITVGSTISYTLSASGYPLPTFRVTDGTLPPNLSLNTTSGVLHGTFTEGGTYNFTVTASNGVAPSDTQAITLSVCCTIFLPFLER